MCVVAVLTRCQSMFKLGIAKLILDLVRFFPINYLLQQIEDLQVTNLQCVISLQRISINRNHFENVIFASFLASLKRLFLANMMQWYCVQNSLVAMEALSIRKSQVGCTCISSGPPAFQVEFELSRVSVVLDTRLHKHYVFKTTAEPSYTQKAFHKNYLD